MIGFQTSPGHPTKYRIEYLQSNDTGSIFLLLDLHFQGQALGIVFDLQISLINDVKQQTLLLPLNRKKCLGFRLAYLHLTLVH